MNGENTEVRESVTVRPGARRVEPPLARLAWGALNALQLAFTLLWSAAGITVALVVLVVTRRPALPLGMARWMWAPGLLRGAGARLDVAWEEPLPAGTAVLFASNHQSMIDIPALFVALRVPLRFVVKRELGSVPFLGWYVAAMGMVLIDRGARGRAVRSLRRVTDILRSGHCVACFPEGTRSRDGSIGAFKSGSFAMAIDAGVPVVPVALTGSGAVLPRSGFRVRPGTIRVRVGRPIPCSSLTVAERGRLAERVRAEVVRLAAGA